MEGDKYYGKKIEGSATCHIKTEAEKIKEIVESIPVKRAIAALMLAGVIDKHGHLASPYSEEIFLQKTLKEADKSKGQAGPDR